MQKDSYKVFKQSKMNQLHENIGQNTIRKQIMLTRNFKDHQMKKMKQPTPIYKSNNKSIMAIFEFITSSIPCQQPITNKT